MSGMYLATPPLGHDSEHGDFADTDEEGEVESRSEDPRKYQIGLYFPVCIGDYIVDRYHIEHKLGHGAFSTVWLAHDILKKRDVALKIMIPGDSAEHEVRIQNEIKQTIKDTSNLVLYLDTFFIPGYNDCNHRVLVFPALGPGINSIFLTRSISRANRMSAAKQLLEALVSLHDSGFIHGDLNGGNIMWGMVPFDNYSTKMKYKHLGRPLKIPLSLKKPAELVRPATITKSMLTDTIYLGDFGLTTRADIQAMEGWRPPAEFCAPELYHKIKPSFASDMWSYMCIFTQLYSGIPIFSNGLSTISMILGPMPGQWRDLLEGSKEQWYDQSRKADLDAEIEYFLDRQVPTADLAERRQMLSIMTRVFRYEPAERMTALQLLRDPSFEALMESYQSRFPI